MPRPSGCGRFVWLPFGAASRTQAAYLGIRRADCWRGHINSITDTSIVSFVVAGDFLFPDPLPGRRALASPSRGLRPADFTLRRTPSALTTSDRHSLPHYRAGFGKIGAFILGHRAQSLVSSTGWERATYTLRAGEGATGLHPPRSLAFRITHCKHRAGRKPI